MCEHSNINSTAALREARRRKILENSANRLKLIEGISSFSEKLSTETFQEPKPDSELQISNNESSQKSGPEPNSKFIDFIKTNKELKEISEFLSKDHNKIPYDEAEEEVIEAEADVQEGYAFLRIFFQKRLHYVLLALIVNVLLFLNAGSFFYENIFCPFYTVKTIELVSKRGVKEDIQPVLYLLIAGLPKSVQKLTKKILLVLLAVFSDLSIYLFTFIIGTKIMNNVN